MSVGHQIDRAYHADFQLLCRGNIIIDWSMHWRRGISNRTTWKTMICTVSPVYCLKGCCIQRDSWSWGLDAVSDCIWVLSCI